MKINILLPYKEKFDEMKASSVSITVKNNLYHSSFINDIKVFGQNVEKPLFNKEEKKFKFLKNKYFVGYNLRHHPALKYVKKYIKNKKIYFINNNCSTYLPNWRKKKYQKTHLLQVINYLIF